MNRKKKMRKLGLIQKPQKSKEDIKHQEMVDNILKNLASKSSNRKFIKKLNEEWIESYGKTFPRTLTEPSKNWANGTTAKKSVFEPINFNDMDIESINEKRKRANIDTTIEQGSAHAIEEARAKSKRVAVVCHKSSYQYVGSGSDVKNFGKKTEQYN